MGTIFYKDKPYGGGGSNVKELSKSEYNALSTYEKNNGTLYLVNGRTGVTDQVTGITIGEYIENHSVCEDTVSQDGTSVVSEYLGGGQIGNDFWFVDKIDVTIYDHISYDLDLGTCYGTSATWNYTVGLMSAIPNTWWYSNNTTDYVVKKTHDTAETTYTNQELDVSGLTGEYYIAVVAHGWNATLSNIRLVTENALPNSIYYKSVEFANNQVPIELTQSEYDNLDITAKCNGSIYFVNASESDWVFAHTAENATWTYSEVPSTARYLVSITSLNNVCYAGIHYTVAGQVARVLTTEEQSAIATKLGMSSTYASSQTIGGSGTSQASNAWRDGNNNDRVYISESSLSNVGTKTDYGGCKAHLFYKTGGARRVYYNNKLWSEIIL